MFRYNLGKAPMKVPEAMSALQYCSKYKTGV